MPDAQAPPPPLPNTYWVIPGRLLAGEYPGGNSARETQERLAKLIGVGIRCFIDLTQPDERDPYDAELPLEIEYLRKPIKDHGLPARREHMIEIQACLDHAMRTGVPTYIHCRAGIGRTGMSVACFLVEQGLAGEAALDELNRLWQQCQRSGSWPYVPETEEQCDYVRTWIPQVAGLLKERVAAREREDPLMEPSTLDAAKVLRDRFLGAARVLLVIGILAGGVFAFGQEARGAHFLSHDLASAAIVWFTQLALYWRMLAPTKAVSRARERLLESRACPLALCSSPKTSTTTR